MPNTTRCHALRLPFLILALWLPNGYASAIVAFQPSFGVVAARAPQAPVAKQLKSEKPVTDSLAIIALVGLWLFPPISIIFGFISMRRIKRNPERFKGYSLAKVSFILGIVFTVIMIAAFGALSLLFAGWKR